MNRFFPDDGSVNRTFLFMKPTSDEIPYFIILDDIVTDEGTPMEWIQHGLENLTLNANDRSWTFTTQDYFEGNNVSLYGKIITPGVSLKEERGYTAIHPKHSKEASYILAESTGSQQLCTILVPLNGSMTAPDISIIENTREESCIKIEHEESYDLIWSRFAATKDEITTDVDGWIPEAASFNLRLNTSNEAVFSLGFQDATLLTKDSTEYFTASSPVSGAISLTGTGLDGTITTLSTTTVEIRMEDPGSLLINGNVHTYEYSAGNVVMVLSKGTHTIGNQGSNAAPPEEKVEMVDIEDALNKIEGLSHPYLIFNQTEVAGILTNISTKEPLTTIYGELESQVNGVTWFDGADVKFEQSRHEKEVFVGLIIQFLNGSDDALNQLKLILEQCNEYPYSQGQTLSTARLGPVLAMVFDAIYNNLTTNERVQYGQNLKDYADPLAETLDITPMNNHLGDRTGAIGTIGLVLKDRDLLEKACEGAATFLNKETVDGIPIESFFYAHAGYSGFLPFVFSLKKLDIINVFQENSPMDRFFERTVAMSSPAGIWPHYEDASDSSDHAYKLRLYSHLTDNQALRENIVYLNEIQNRSEYTTYNFYDTHYEYWELFVWKDPAPPSPPENENISWITYEGGNGALRTDWTEDAVFLSMNAKTYHQSHTHLDELSYEIHAYGAWLVTNVGYPGWKRENHAFAVSSMGSNTIRLNHQDQLQETCEGFSFHAFSKEVDIVQMEGGDLYRSPYHISQNPTYYIINISLQVLFAGFSVYIIYLLRSNGGYSRSNAPDGKLKHLFRKIKIEGKGEGEK